MKIGLSHTLNIFFIAAFLPLFTLGQIKPLSEEKEQISLQYGAHRIGKRSDVAMEKWRNYSLGQFIHWGVYAIAGGQWKGKEYPGAAEWIRSWSVKDGAPEEWKKTYDNLYRQFNPTEFDAKAWARQAKEMGAKYVIFTTKHHDGFCLWPSKFTDYTIANTPYKRDIVKEVVDAYDAEGIDVYLYFSIIDWNHEGYQSQAPTTAAQKSAYDDFKAFTRNQLVELLKNYPSMKGFWFDGTWDQAWVKQASWTDSLEKELRNLHPGLIIGSRFRADELGNRHFDANGNLIGDYEQGWERKLPAAIDVVKGNDWDCVMTIPPNQWGYNANWADSYIKTPYDLSAMLMHTRSMNGNFVVNFGPDGTGKIRAEEAEIAAKLGKWVKINAEAIYGTTYSGLPKPDYGYITKKENKLYLTVFNIPLNGTIRIAVPKSEAQKPVKAWLLEGKQVLNLVKTHIGLDKDKNTYFDISLIKKTGEMPFVIVIELDHPDSGNPDYGDAKT